jgi:hypothetical protein
LNPRTIKNAIFSEWRNLPALSGHGVAFPNTGAKAFRDLRLTSGRPVTHHIFSFQGANLFILNPEIFQNSTQAFYQYFLTKQLISVNFI